MNSDLAIIRRSALDLARPLVQGRTVVLTASAAGSRRIARFLTDAGAYVVPVDLGVVATNTHDRFDEYERTLAQPSAQLRKKLESEDPQCTALVYAGSFTTATTVCGRRVIGARSTLHLDAERKDRQRDFLRRDGHVVDLHELTDVKPPVVVQGVPDCGVAMAASHTYLVPPSGDGRGVRDLTEILRRDCTRAVVTPFDAGLPCTFYGFITPTAIVDFGPVEALVFWDPRTWRIHAPGILRPLSATEDVLASARAEVHAVARRLQLQLGYVGAFGTDGVFTDDGYAIHEINPRVCAGFGLLDQLAPQAAPLAAVDLLLRELPTASAALATPLAALSRALRRLPTPAYRLWDAADQFLAPSDQLAQQGWAQLRTTAAAGRRPVRDLKEHDSWN